MINKDINKDINKVITKVKFFNLLKQGLERPFIKEEIIK